VLDVTTSTNTVAVQLAQEDAPHGTVVVADEQTLGRGRLGRPWYSPPRKNLYCSVLLRVEIPRGRLGHWFSWIPLIAGLAAAQAIETLAGLAPRIKWPNDLLLGSRKVGGILCESGALASASPFVVVGLGLNVNTATEEFPCELREHATSLAAEAQRPFDRAAVLATFLSFLEDRCQAFLNGLDADIHQGYVARCATLGQQIRVERVGGASVVGLATSIGTDGSLQILQADGSVLDLHAGDVIHVRAR
jgi:BirA family biotin operon repressor/biotin-[acetyl-CoA-carboxylase] ligase